MVKPVKNNRILEILRENGFENFTPTDQLLNDLGMNRIRFKRVLGNVSQIRPLELRAFATWLKVSEKELIGEGENDSAN